MWSYVIRRLLIAIPTLLGVTVIMFTLLKITPGDPLNALLPPEATQLEREELAHDLGLDKPIYVQYFLWISDAVQFDFGRSYVRKNPVIDELSLSLKNTFVLAMASAAVAFVTGITLGTLAAFYRGKWPDKVASGVAAMGISVPNYWVVILLITVFSVQLSWLPSQGMRTVGADSSFKDLLEHMVIPVTALSLITAGILTRMMRASVLEILNQEFVVSLRAKGLGRTALTKHIIKNSAPPVVTLMGLQLGNLMGGSVLVESIVNWPGAGGLLNLAIQQRDIPVIQATVLVLACAFVFLNIAVDILHTVLDPRVRRT
jgi:peptide/nickel transport system permease protein